MNNREKLSIAAEEYESVLLMPESDACLLYNVDSRAEIEAILTEEISALESRIQEEECECAQLLEF
jgi:hypothetical protein